MVLKVMPSIIESKTSTYTSSESGSRCTLVYCQQSGGFFIEKLIVRLQNNLIIRVGAKLHNYVINTNWFFLSSADVNDISTFGFLPLPNSFEGNNGYLPTYNTNQTSSVDGIFGGRLTILNRIIHHKLVRSLHNIRCNND